MAYCLSILMTMLTITKEMSRKVSGTHAYVLANRALDYYLHWYGVWAVIGEQTRDTAILVCQDLGDWCWKAN